MTSSLCTAPIPPPPPPPPEISPLPPDLPPDRPETNVTLVFNPPEAPGGEIQEYIVLLVALGDASQSESRRRRQAAGDFLMDCVVNINRIFSVPPDVTQLSVSVGMFSDIFTQFLVMFACFIAACIMFLLLFSFFHNL